MQTIQTVLSIICGGGIVGIITLFIALGGYKQRVIDLENKIEDYEKQNRVRFNELYNSRNGSNERIARLEERTSK